MSWGISMCKSWYGDEANIKSLAVPPWPDCLKSDADAQAFIDAYSITDTTETKGD